MLGFFPKEITYFGLKSSELINLLRFSLSFEISLLENKKFWEK